MAQPLRPYPPPLRSLWSHFTFFGEIFLQRPFFAASLIGGRFPFPSRLTSVISSSRRNWNICQALHIWTEKFRPSKSKFFMLNKCFYTVQLFYATLCLSECMSVFLSIHVRPNLCISAYLPLLQLSTENDNN